MSSPLVAERKHNPAIQQLLKACVLDTGFSSDPDNLEEFLAECIQEGLAGGLARQIDHYGHPNPELCRRSREIFKNQFFQYAQYQVLLTEINRGLLRKGAQVLLLKGAALNRNSYSPGVRHVSDLDLFVPAQYEQKLVDLLAEMGFNRSKSLSMFSTRSGLLVDLHGPELGRVEAAVGLRGAELWRRSTIDPQCPGLRLLAPPDETAYLAVHSLKHSYARYIWFWDLAICLQRPDHKPPSSRAQAYAIQCAELLLRELLNRPHPRALTLTRVDQRLLLTMLSTHRHPMGQVLIGCNLPRLDRLKYFWNTLSESGNLSFPRLLEKLLVLGSLSLSHLYQSLVKRRPGSARREGSQSEPEMSSVFEGAGQTIQPEGEIDGQE